MKEQNEKQAAIEKIARIIHGTPFSDMHRAVAIYNAGYRKQSVGEWVAKSEMVRTPTAKNHYCSVCKYEANETTDFCPNCGARMKGGAE